MDATWTELAAMRTLQAVRGDDKLGLFREFAQGFGHVVGNTLVDWSLDGSHVAFMDRCQAETVLEGMDNGTKDTVFRLVFDGQLLAAGRRSGPRQVVAFSARSDASCRRFAAAVLEAACSPVLDFEMSVPLRRLMDFGVTADVSLPDGTLRFRKSEFLLLMRGGDHAAAVYAVEGNDFLFQQAQGSEQTEFLSGDVNQATSRFRTAAAEMVERFLTQTQESGCRSKDWRLVTVQTSKTSSFALVRDRGSLYHRSVGAEAGAKQVIDHAAGEQAASSFRASLSNAILEVQDAVLENRASTFMP